MMNRDTSFLQAKSVQFELTPHCNMNCRSCYMHESKEVGRETLPASFWLEQAKQAADEGVLVLSLTGGETLLYPELDALMQGLSTIGFLISFNTNGLLVDEERTAWFSKYGPNKINISLYGASNETYEQFCGVKHGFTRVAYAIDLLLAAGLNVYLNGLITPYNLHELLQMHQFAAERGLILHASSYAFPLRTHPGEDVRGEYRFAPEEAARAAILQERHQYGAEQFLRMGAVRLRQVDLARRGILHTTCTSCNGGTSTCQISYDGMLHPCAMYQDVCISLRDTAYRDAAQLLSKKMQAIPFPEPCDACARKVLCPMCRAAVFLETGNTGDSPEYLCKYTEAYEALLRKESSGITGPLPPVWEQEWSNGCVL